MGNLGGIVASRVARTLKAGGPSFTVSSEENSGLAALSTAIEQLRGGRLSMALVGAVDLAGDLRAVLAQDEGRAYSRDGDAKPWSNQAQGSVVEGAVAFVLKRKADALRDGNTIIATIAAHEAAMAPQVEELIPTKNGLQSLTEQVDAELRKQVGFIAGHGSAIAKEDMNELAQIEQCYQDGADKALSSAAVLGHTGAASGLFSLLQAVCALEHHTLPSQGAFMMTVMLAFMAPINCAIGCVTALMVRASLRSMA